jgi:hypothetical protein
MTTKRALLVSIIIFAGVSLVGAQSPISPSASPEASASPAKKTRKKKAEASPAPAASPEASASPAKTRGRKKAETSPAPAASPEASASPAKTRGHKKAEMSPAPNASPAASPAERQARKKAGASPTAAPAASASPAKPFSIGSLFKPKPTASPATTTTGSAETNATPAPGGGHGLVWVNTDSHVYHKEGSRFYGKTKQGKYVSEADAIKEGDRASKTND